MPEGASETVILFMACARSWKQTFTPVRDKQSTCPNSRSRDDGIDVVKLGHRIPNQRAPLHSDSLLPRQNNLVTCGYQMQRSHSGLGMVQWKRSGKRRRADPEKFWETPEISELGLEVSSWHNYKIPEFWASSEEAPEVLSTIKCWEWRRTGANTRTFEKHEHRTTLQVMPHDTSDWL